MDLSASRWLAGLLVASALVGASACGGDYEPVAAYHGTLVPAPTGLTARIDSVAGSRTQVRVRLDWSHPMPSVVARYQIRRRDLSSAVPTFLTVKDTTATTAQFLQNRPTATDSIRIEVTVQAVGTEQARGFIGPAAAPVTLTIRK